MGQQRLSVSINSQTLKSSQSTPPQSGRHGATEDVKPGMASCGQQATAANLQKWLKRFESENV